LVSDCKTFVVWGAKSTCLEEDTLLDVRLCRGSRVSLADHPVARRRPGEDVFSLLLAQNT
jgi:hypothetical protein